MIGKARTIVACVVAAIGATAVAVPIGTYFNTARTVQYREVYSNISVGYASPLPSPPDHGSDYSVRILSSEFKLFTEVGTKGIKVVYVFEPKPGTSVPRLRHVVSIEIVKGKAVPYVLTSNESFKKGGTEFPFKSESQLPEPPIGFKRPWVVPQIATSTAFEGRPTFIFKTNDKPLTAATLKNIPVNQQFTATYEAAVDTDRFEGDQSSQFVVTYTVVQ